MREREVVVARRRAGDSGSRQAELVERAGRAITEAARAVGRSERLVSAERLLAEREAMLTRCAWCERVRLGDLWTSRGDVPIFLDRLLDREEAERRTTHGICDECVGALRRSGQSRAS